jgi:hypothetical protein
MVRKKTQDHKTTGGPNEKKNEEIIVNMVMAITTRNKVSKEVVFRRENLSTGRNPRIGKKR